MLIFNILGLFHNFQLQSYKFFKKRHKKVNESTGQRANRSTGQRACERVGVGLSNHQIIKFSKFRPVGS